MGQWEFRQQRLSGIVAVYKLEVSERVGVDGGGASGSERESGYYWVVFKIQYW